MTIPAEARTPVYRIAWVIAETASTGSIQVACPYCDRIHHHGHAGASPDEQPGWRSVHCDEKDRPDYFVAFPVGFRRGAAKRGAKRVPPAERTHCPHGHPYDEENTYHHPNGGRRCRECKRAARRAEREKLRAQREAARTEIDRLRGES